MLLKHVRFLGRIHVVTSIIQLITSCVEWGVRGSDGGTTQETSDLLCMLLTDVLYKYSYNEKYNKLIQVGMCGAAHIKELLNEDLLHALMMRLKTHPNYYIMTLCEVRLLLLSHLASLQTHLRVRDPRGARQLHQVRSPGGRLRTLSPLSQHQLPNQFAPIASLLYNSLSIYVMYLIKQLYRHLPSPAQLAVVLEDRFHLIDTFQLGDLTQKNPQRDDADMHIGTSVLSLLRIVYYIVLGFYCAGGRVA